MGRHTLTAKRLRRPRVRALLAGGVALGLGATMTLASWTDNEWSQATFATSSFDTQSSMDSGVSYADNTVSPGTAMVFSGSGMSPATVRYANTLVRTKIGSIAGTIVLGAGSFSPAGTDETTVLGAALRYRVVSTTASCAASAFTGSPTWVVGPTASTLGTAGSSAVVLAAATAVAPGAASGLCFEVTLPAGAASTLQGKASTVIWQITASST